MNQLPEKKSELIRVAIRDLKACENDPKYEINMGTWHYPVEDVCYVCLAGSVLSKSLNINFHENVGPYSYNNELTKKLLFLDHARVGYLSKEMDLGIIDSTTEQPVQYVYSPSLFKQLKNTK